MNTHYSPYPVINPLINDYLDQLFRDGDPVLAEMEKLAKRRQFPIVGRQAGYFLEIMALSIQARRIFEFGSGFGYSAYWFSKAVGADGKVICCDLDQQNQHLAKGFLQAANLWEGVEYHIALAQDVFLQYPGEFDLVFNDADKADYPEIYRLAKSKLRRGGIYVADNVLWDGQVAMESEEDADDWTASIMKHNRLLVNDPDFKVFINPIRDGLLTAIKL